MRREALTKSNATYEILQFYSTWKTTISLTKQITGFYSIHFWQLWYWDNTTRIFLTSTANQAIEVPINASSQTMPKGNAESKQTLIISQQFFKFYKSQVNKEEQLSAAKQRFHHNRCKNKSSSENRRIFLPQFYTEAMRSSQVLTHARTRSCSTHHLRVWEHVQVKESQQLLFQKSPQVFQGGAHTLCKIDESNNNVGRATVFDTKKGCDE